MRQSLSTIISANIKKCKKNDSIDELNFIHPAFDWVTRHFGICAKKIKNGVSANINNEVTLYLTKEDENAHIVLLTNNQKQWSAACSINSWAKISQLVSQGYNSFKN